jgi:hypothetical protein
MKEYKVVTLKAESAFSLGNNWQQRYEDLLNRYAKQGWIVCKILQRGTIVFEKDKNK